MSRKLVGLVFVLLLSTAVYSQIQYEWPVPYVNEWIGEIASGIKDTQTDERPVQ